MGRTSFTLRLVYSTRFHQVFPDRHYLFYETVEVAGHQAFIVAIYKGV